MDYRNKITKVLPSTFVDHAILEIEGKTFYDNHFTGCYGLISKKVFQKCSFNWINSMFFTDCAFLDCTFDKVKGTFDSCTFKRCHVFDLKDASFDFCTESGTTHSLIAPTHGWKKAYLQDRRSALVEIEVQGKAVTKVFGGDLGKWRTQKAYIKAAYSGGQILLPSTLLISEFNRTFIYRQGDTIDIPDFDDSLFTECTKGFHFFTSYDEARSF